MSGVDPHPPTAVDPGVPSKGDRRANGSPPPVPSKRDKKRQLLAERLAALTEKFNRDRDATYREQLHQIQIDTNLVMRVDPYDDRPLDFIEPTRRDRERTLNPDADRESQTGGRSILEMAGPTFHQWHQDVEDLLEERDFALTQQKHEFERKMQEYRHTHSYKIEVANREYIAQKNTIRDRLLNSISSRKMRLAKDKEVTDISDHPSALLHPNQFSINNPASPGGIHNKRATRLRQNADDVTDGRKRKRNAIDEDGSPAPQRRAADMNGTTALWQGDRLANRTETGPVYSIEKLFTDKELSMHHNAAALAAHKHLLLHQGKVNGNGQASYSPSGSESGDHEDDQDGTDSAPSAVPMERIPSHATRSTRAGAQNQNLVDDKLVGLEALANFEMPANLEKMIAAEPKLPPTFVTTYAKPATKGEANTPATLPQDDINSDLMVMKLLQQYDSLHGTGSNLDTNNGGRKVLEAAAYTLRDDRYVAFLRHEKRDPDELRRDLRLPANTLRGDPITPSGPSNPAIAAPTSAPMGASPMSRQSSQGGAAMSRQGSNTRAQRKRLQ